MSEQSLPLAGVKVVELSTFIAASTTGRFFANLGAVFRPAQVQFGV